MANLKQSTTYTRMFLLVQSSDHETGLTGASPSVTISKAGGAFGAAAGAVTEVSSGWYKVALTTADTGTLGDLAFHITATSGDPTDFVDQVTANILGDAMTANVTQVNGHAVTDTASGVLDVNAKNINNVSASPVTTIGANVGTTQPVNFTGTGAAAYVKSDVTDWKAATAPAMTGDAYARLGAPAGASVSADVAAIKSDTGTILNDVNVGAGAIYTRLGAPAGASIAADIAAVAGGVWDITLSGHLTAGTSGAALNAAGSAGDPWTASLPGAYDPGSAGYILGTDLPAVKTKTDELTFTTPNQVDAAAVTVGDKTNYSLGQSFPTNFAAMSIDASGNVAGTSNVKKNTAKDGFMLVMTDAITHAPKPSLTVAALRAIDSTAYASCDNSVTEVSNGTYAINLSAADMNGDHIMLRFTAAGADDLNIEIVTQP